MENHSDTDSSQILGDWDFPLPVNTESVYLSGDSKANATNEVDKERGSMSTVGKGKEDPAKKRILPPWIDPSWEWGGGKWKVDGRKRKKKKKEKKESDEHGGSGASDLSIEDLMDEYSSRPPQIAEWFWCIEYVAKFVKDLRCILDLMNMGYHCTNDYGRRINEVLSLRVLEFMFDPSKNDATRVGVAAEPRVEFDLSLSNTDVLNAVRKDIPLSELRPGMPELSKFNVLPFIAHKNMFLPQCALEKLRDVSLMENQTSAGPSKEANDPVLRDDRSMHMDVCEENSRDEQQVNIGSEQTDINKKDKVIVIDDKDDPRQTNEKDEVIVIDGDDTTDEPINNGNTTCKTFAPSSDARVKCTKDGTWLISGSDDESDMGKGPALANKNMNIPSSSRTRLENVCWKCEEEGTLLICSRSECAAKVHKECLNCPVNFDEDGNFHCPVCWYDRVTMDYHESQKLMSYAKRRLVKFLPVLYRRSKRLR